MCLIIYAPNAQEIPRDHFWQAAADNNDGIGIMSTYGVEKFMGRKKTKRAYRYAAELARLAIPYAVHFRYATHGRVSRSNTHPFEIPGTPYLMMHNGILWTAAAATDDKSDTALFAEDIMPEYVALRTSADTAGRLAEWREALGQEAGYSKLLLLNTETGSFDIINALWGEWLNGMWYSNTYSLPAGSVASTNYLTRAIVNRTASKPGHVPMASGPTLNPDGDDTEAWFYEARLRDMRREQGGRFDWHDRATWDRYPLPGSWEDRFPLAEDTDGPNYAADDDGLDGVQQYV